MKQNRGQLRGCSLFDIDKHIIKKPDMTICMAWPYLLIVEDSGRPVFLSVLLRRHSSPRLKYL